MTLHKQLYKLNSNGKSIQSWAIHKAKNNKSYWTVSGQVDGKQTTSKPTAVVPKVKRTQLEQVRLEMDSKINLKVRKKYVEDIKNVGAKADKALPGYTAMLAKKWKDQKKKITFPCVVQPKLDGVRCLATKDGLFTRSRKPIEACQHVHEALKPFFEAHPEAYLDGELYTHEFKDDFEKIIKAVRKSGKRVTEEDLALQAKVQYHIYDVPRIVDLTETDSFSDRLHLGTQAVILATGAVEEVDGITVLHDALRIVMTINVMDEDALFEWHGRFLQLGYEGTMIRNADMPYENKRSSQLLKLKEFDEGEFVITGVLEGKGGLAGHAGAFTLENEDGTEFRAKLDGSHDRLKWIWENPDSVIGKMATIVYQGLTNKNFVPRFPVAKDVRGLTDRSDWL